MKKGTISIVILIFFISCSTKRDNFKNRNYHKMTAWFNGLFNAEEEFDAILKENKNSYEEDFSNFLPLKSNYYSSNSSVINPGLSLNFNDFNSRNNQANEAPSGFDAVEKRAFTAIEKHSMLINGKERNSMIARAYLLIGKSKFHQAKYYEALESLNNVTKNFPESKYYNEASLYSALSDLYGANYFEGQENLLKLFDNKNLPKNIKYLISINYADFLIENENYKEAIEPLKEAITFSNTKEEQARCMFVLGQVYSKLKMQEDAGKMFENVYKLKPGYNMEVKANLAIANNFDPEINNYSNYKKYILEQSKKGIYASLNNEFYYAIADMAFKAGNLDDAIKYAKLSLQEPESDPYIRAKTYEKISEINFKNEDYLLATKYLDSAMLRYINPKEIERVSNLNKNLKEIVDLHYLVEKNDSILKLSNLDEQEQKLFFENYITNLKKEEEKQLAKEIAENTSFALDNQSKGFSSNFIDTNDKNKFYFYNSTLKNNGKIEFRRKWNNASLQDNWRSSKSSTNTSIKDEIAALSGNNSIGNPRRFEVEYYLENIPKDQNTLNDLKIQRDTAQLNLGIGYFEYLDNIPLAAKTLESLISSPPKEEEIVKKAYYQLYKIYKDRDKLLEDKYKNFILSNYPESIYAGYITNPSILFVSEENKDALASYKKAYDFYENENYNDARIIITEALNKYPSLLISAKFALLNAYIIGKTESKDNFLKALELVNFGYDGTDEGKFAAQLLNKLQENIKEENTLQGQTDVLEKQVD